MYSTQAIENIRKSLQDNNGVNLAFCVCDNQKFNSIVLAYRNNEISLESATQKALSTIIEQPKKRRKACG
ncbi:hypothetical protein [Vibrio sp. 1180_3]|uniref:hypothetical protein n=1 Tax=Vibrio sp. 1180_3 TaxID=2528832 RepID=UPI0024065623|nr:hypothetical protein [Vibrio sp. 1180_3]MDF9399178.1 hypothetical protein [Vibrio sp. 1180_3]